jgi:predicted phage terminase large subunit-like protein
MPASEEIRKRVENAYALIAAKGVSLEYVNALFQYGRYAIEHDEDESYGLKVIRAARDYLEQRIDDGKGRNVWQLQAYSYKMDVEIPDVTLYFKILLYEAQHKVLDSYLLYIEKDRLPKDRFYLPRRKCLQKIGVIDALQDLLEDKLDILSISLPPGTGKTTLEMFFHSALLGWYPNDFSLFYSHSGDITKMYYSGVLNILTSDEYCWQKIFPDHRVYTTDAKREQIHIDKYQPFASLQTTSVGAKNAGKVRAGLFLLCDDIIGGIEEALNINILDKLWNIYSVDARQRKIPGAKELHICTRWSVNDIVGRIQRLYDGSDRVRFIAVPDIDPVTGKSNFNYDINGFTEEFFHDQELAMDDISYRCLYKNDPIEREGLLYTEDELRYFADLPLREPDAIMAVCDTKSKGTDFLVLPVLYQYDNDYYMVDCICTDSSDYGVQYGRMADMIVSHNVQQCEFESNAGGDRVAFEVEGLVKAKNGRCNITTKPTETNKETRIIVNADWIKKNVLFKPKEAWGTKTDYYTFMTWLLSYSVSGKNKHDDVPDCMANFALFVQNKYRIKPTYVIHSPF